MKEIRPRSSYDIARSSAWSGPYRSPSRFLSTLANVVLAIVLGASLGILAILELSK